MSTHKRVPCEDLKLGDGLAGAGQRGGGGEEAVDALYLLARRLNLVDECPGLSFLCKLPHPVAGVLLALPDVIVGAVGYTWLGLEERWIQSDKHAQKLRKLQQNSLLKNEFLASFFSLCFFLLQCVVYSSLCHMW